MAVSRRKMTNYTEVHQNRKMLKKVYDKKRRNTPAGKAARKLYNNSPAAKASNTAYRSSSAGRAVKWAWGLQHRYNITPEAWYALFEAQNWKCPFCNRDGSDIKKGHLPGLKWHTDHDHVTGKIRGILCPPCNVFLGYVKDDPKVFLNAIQYLAVKR